MKPSPLIRILGLFLNPLLRYLGYRDEVTKLSFPESFYYSGRSGMKDLAEIHRGYLSQSGWVESRNYNRSFFSGEFKPWLTFAANHFLDRLDMTDMLIVEFGGGASTVWFSKRANQVKTYEFDAGWASVLSRSLAEADHVEILLPDTQVGLLRHFNSEPNSGFSSALAADIESDPFVRSTQGPLSEAQIILIDGGPRNLAMLLASKYASPKAIIVVDNSDTNSLREGIDFLLEAGFIEIPFRGLGPLNPFEWSTSIFIRDLGSLR